MEKKQYIKPESAIVEMEGTMILAGSEKLGRGQASGGPTDEWPNNPDSENRLWAE